MKSLNLIRANVGREVREELLDGKRHLVVPVIILKEGVHNGSGGPAYYEKQDLQKYVDSWNGIPVVVPSHPRNEEGMPVSANSPNVIEKCCVGRLFNVGYEEKEELGRLKGEIWTDIEKASKVDISLLEKMRRLDPVEVSTGLFSDNDQEAGKWNGETYNTIVRNYIPDHLAILLSEKGACSYEDGCGIRFNNKKEANMAKSKSQKKRLDAMIANELTPYSEEHMEEMEKLSECQLTQIESLVSNAEEVNEKYLSTQEQLEKIQGELELTKNSLKETESKYGEVMKSIENKKEDEVTVDTYIQKAPEGVREVLRNGMEVIKKEKDTIITNVLKNKKNTFTQEELNILDMNFLRKLGALSKEDDYSLRVQASGKIIKERENKGVPDPEPIWDI